MKQKQNFLFKKSLFLQQSLHKVKNISIQKDSNRSLDSKYVKNIKRPQGSGEIPMRN